MEKFFSTRVLESWDSFCNNEPNNDKKESDTVVYGEAPKKIVRKQDGLIERMDNKTLISEDNRQLLND